MADYYSILGVRPDADRSAIQAAYRDLARRHHPDFGGDETRMAALNEAWGVLGDPVERAAYDVRRRLPVSSAGTPSTPPPAPAGPIAAAAARRTAHTRGRPLDFGRYAGWTIAELARHDPDYLEWLARAPVGLAFRTEIYTELAKRPAARMVATASRDRYERPRRFAFGRLRA